MFIPYKLIAVSVSAALTSSVFSSSMAKDSGQSFNFKNYNKSSFYPSFQKSNDIQYKLLRTLQVNNEPRVLGQKNSFSSAMGVDTFRWHDDFLKPTQLKNINNSKSYLDKVSREYLEENEGTHALNSQAVKEAKLMFVSNTGKGPIVTKYQQMVDGIEVFGRQIAVLMNSKQQLVATSGFFASVDKQVSQSAQRFSLTGKRALEIAASSLGGSIAVKESENKAGSEYSKYSFSNGAEVKLVVSDNSRTKKVFYPYGGSLIPAYYVEVLGSEAGTTRHIGYSFVISATDGEMLFRKNLTEDTEFSYRVYADNDSHIPFDSPYGDELTPNPLGVPGDIDVSEAAQNIITLSQGPIAGVQPWLESSATQTAGNNVLAYADIVEPDGLQTDLGDVFPSLTGTSLFGYTHDLDDPTSTDSISASTVNLFYMNNYLHNWFYANGFDEAAGNAQADNFSRGGVGNDRLHVEAQDNSGMNNANMSTPADGESPRMQMYMWGQSSSSYQIGSITPGVVGIGQFGPQEFNVSGTVVAVIDSVAPESDGCDALTNAAELSGNIAIIDRGSCNFTDKVRSAQEAGAIAAIIANNDTENPNDVINLGGDATDITIPSIMVSYNNGQSIYAEMAGGSITATLTRTIDLRDGTLDNGIVAHEWAHYLSNRLVGNAAGLFNNQGRGMGEGWSDFVALLFAAREEDALLPGNDQFQGAYSVAGFATTDYYFGIRRFPYSTDRDINDITFKHVEEGVALPATHPIAYGQDGSGNSAVHATGSVWSTMLWEAYVDLINREDLSFSEAQDRMKTYLVEGLKMTPIAPTLTEARDGILAVAAATDMADYNTILAAFTERGMGLNAVAPPRFDNNNAGVVEDFDSNAKSSFAITSATIVSDVVLPGLSSCDNDGILDTSETAVLYITIRNDGDQALSPTGVISSANDVTFPDGQNIAFELSGTLGEEATVMVPVTVNSAAAGEEFSFTISFADLGPDVNVPSDVTVSVQGELDYATGGSVDDFETTLTSTRDWTVTTTTIDGANNWALDGAQYDQFFSRGQMFRGPSSRSPEMLTLESPVVTVAETGDFSFSFFHYTGMEYLEISEVEFSILDAGVLEVSIDGGDWTDVNRLISDNGQFTQLVQYQAPVNDSNPYLAGRQAFGVPNFPGDTVVVTIPESQVLHNEQETINGKTVQVRFVMANGETGSDLGWLIDEFQFNNVVDGPFSSLVADDGVCGNSAPYVADIADLEVSEKDGNAQRIVTLDVEAVDNESDSLTYSWTQTSGEEATLSGATTSQMSFTVPVINSDQVLGFAVDVSDGTNTVTKTVSVKVNDVNEIPVLSISGDTSVRAGRTGSLSVNVDDGDDANFTYVWTVASGEGVTIDSGESTSSISFTAPRTAGDISFNVEVSDGKATVDATQTVTVTKKSSGGGSLGWLVLGLLGLSGLRRKWK
ncbi:M36 family metallopeptidase [Pleionea sediminis]|uniref:M36 family metallopeptidase n=1 Tax=Pleionea sediminis TaxID=2569479 RepID=UPI001184F197|nr:M36 family metallopeptidase [Pleionea sediminis]